MTLRTSNETPRTDEAIRSDGHTEGIAWNKNTAAFARQLEIELAKSEKENRILMRRLARLSIPT